MRTQWLGGKVRELFHEPRARDAIVALKLTTPRIIVGQHTTIEDDGPDVRSIQMVLEQDSVSVEVILPTPDETVAELVEALNWLHEETI